MTFTNEFFAYSIHQTVPTLIGAPAWLAMAPVKLCRLPVHSRRTVTLLLTTVLTLLRKGYVHRCTVCTCTVNSLTLYVLGVMPLCRLQDICVFKEPPSRKLCCPLCKNVFKDPVITTCGVSVFEFTSLSPKSPWRTNY